MNVIIYGDKNDKSLNEVLVRTLKKYGEVKLYYEDKNIFMPNKCTPKFSIYDIDKMPVDFDESGLFIFKNTFKSMCNKDLPADFLPIFDMQNLKAVKCFENTDRIVITCGMSSKNTLNFSSFNTTDAIVSLQRYIKSENNKVIEPHDFTVRLTQPTEPDEVLQTCAVLLMSGIPSINGYEI